MKTQLKKANLYLSKQFWYPLLNIFKISYRLFHILFSFYILVKLDDFPTSIRYIAEVNGKIKEFSRSIQGLESDFLSNLVGGKWFEKNVWVVDTMTHVED